MFGTFELPCPSLAARKDSLFMSLAGVVPNPGSLQPGIYQDYKDKCSPQGCRDKCKEFSPESSCPATAVEHKRCERRR